MALLWGLRKKPTRGPRQGLSVEEIVRVAVDAADEEGLAALSMRRVAERLGVTAMSLYTYVPGKAELVDIMLDAVVGETVEADHGDDAGGGWRDNLEAAARRNWDLYHRHLWMLQVSTMSRPPLGPNAIAKYDQEFRAVDGIGLSEVEMDSVVSLLAGYVQGAARASVEASQVEQRTGMFDDEWWSANAPLLEKVFDPDRYPTAARVGPVAGAAYEAAYDPDFAFEFGLQCILDGVEALVRARDGSINEGGNVSVAIACC